MPIFPEILKNREIQNRNTGFPRRCGNVKQEFAPTKDEAIQVAKKTWRGYFSVVSVVMIQSPIKN